MGPEGRINPELEAQGYRAVEVKDGDNVWEIAREVGADFPETMRLNGDHLIDPSMVFAGDKVYLPGTGRPAETPPADAAPAEPQDPPASPAPSESGSGGCDPAPSPSPTPPSSGSSSGQEPSPAPGSTPESSPVPGTGSGSGADQPTGSDRLSLDSILREYQVKDEETVAWTPDYEIGGIPLPGPLRDIAKDRAEEANGGPIEPKQLPGTEAELLDRLDIFELRDMSGIMTRSFDAADRNFAWSGQAEKFKGQNDGHNDAFRHVYWNALLTRRFGVDFAERYATAHEATPSNPGPREAMDMYNNELGRRIATENPGASEEELQQLVKDAVDRGEAVVIDRNNNLAWSDEVPYLQHGNPPSGTPAQPGVIQPETGS